MAKSKFFRVAVEGATTDGRTIERSWLTQMAATYNRAKYGARVFCEHIRGLVPDGPFRALGDVVAVKAEEIADGELKGKMGLYVQVEPTDALVKLVKSGQKIYTSVEIDQSFADTKLAYLSGLGVTDSPASLGTEVLTFASQHPDASPFRSRKQRPENLFSAGLETVIELEDEPAAADTAGLFARILSKLEGIGRPEPAKPAPKADDVTPTDFSAAVSALTGATKDIAEIGKRTADSLATLQADFAALKTAQATTAGDLASLHTQLDTAPGNHTSRPPATGGNGAVATDC